jgi:segregation and condensation protein B
MDEVEDKQPVETASPAEEHPELAEVDPVAVEDSQNRTGTQPENESGEQSEYQEFDSDDITLESVTEPAAPGPDNAAALKAVIEAAIYITDEPLSAEQIANSVEQPLERVKGILAQLVAEYMAPDRGLSIREIAGGYKMSTKPEHHEPIRRFVKKLQSLLKLSLAALETLAVIAYRQPITGPEVLDVRGVQGAGVLKTLLDRKLIAAAGRKNVLGKPMMYKTTREFLIQFGLNSLAELPTLKEFEELGRMALAEGEESAPSATPVQTEASTGGSHQHTNVAEGEPVHESAAEELSEQSPMDSNHEQHNNHEAAQHQASDFKASDA